MTDTKIEEIHIKGMIFISSRYYHGRYECMGWGRRGREIIEWIRQNFGEVDDFVYATEEFTEEGIRGLDALISQDQLALTLIRWNNNEP